MSLVRMLTGFLALLFASAAVYALGAQRRARARRTRRELVISPLSGLVLGAFLSGFQAIVQPETRHRIVEEQEESHDGQSSSEPPGGQRLVQQLQRIRGGAEVEDLIVRINP